MSVLCIPDAHRQCALCVLEMRHWFGGSSHKDPDPYSQKKHFIGGSADPGSAIRPLWSIKCHVKAKLMKDQPQKCAAVAAAQKTFR